MHLDALALPVAECRGPGGKGADPSLDLLCRPGPVDDPVLLPEHGSEGDGLGVLGARREGPLFHPRHRLHQEPRAERNEPRFQGSCGFVRRHGHAFRQQDRTRVHFRNELHGGHSGDRLPFEDGPLHRRRAAVPGQQRIVNVDASQGRQVQDRLGQYPPVGHHHHEVRTPTPELFQQAGVFHLPGRQDRYPGPVRGPPDRRGRGRLASPGRAVGPGHRAHHLIEPAEQGFQRSRRRGWRPHEDDTHEVTGIGADVLGHPHPHPSPGESGVGALIR